MKYEQDRACLKRYGRFLDYMKPIYFLPNFKTKRVVDSKSGQN